MAKPYTLAERVAAEPKVLIEGVEYLTPKQVAGLLGFSTKTINLLIQQGNKYGKLPVRRRLGFSRWGFVNLIPKDALFTFTFAEVGPYGRPFRFDPEGHRQYVLDL
jgi:predicted DNA-binding transcriptional regulator AlpA